MVIRISALASLGAPDALCGSRDRVGGNAEIDDFGAFGPRQRPQPIAIGIDDLAGAGGRARHDQFVAGGQHCDLRAATYRNLRVVHAGGQRQIAVGQAASAGEQHIALAEIDAGGADMPPSRGRFGDGDVIAIDCRVFLDDDGVGAIGNHAAGENPHRFALAYLPLERAAGGDLADYLQPRGKLGSVSRTHGIAVHRRHGLRRLRAPRCEIARQHAMPGGVERHHFFGQGVCAGKDRSKRVGNRH